MIPLLPDEGMLRRLARLRVQWRAAPGAGIAGSRRGQRTGSSREFLGLRPYEVGDDMRDLDWAATLRFDRPYLRLYCQEMEASLLLLIDVSASMAFGEPAKLAYAQALACALGYVALAHHERVGALAFRETMVARLPAARGNGQWGALRRLVGSLAPAGRTAFAEAPAALGGLRGQHGLAVILSDFAPPEAFAEGLQRLGACPLRAAAVHLMSPQELNPDLEGEIELVDCETGEARGGWIGPAERAAYRAALTGLGTRAAALCRDAGIHYVQVSTAVPIARCLQDTLVRAGVLRREVA